MNTDAESAATRYAAPARPWAAAIIASRESLSTVAQSIDALAAASKQANVALTIDLIVNGNDRLGEQAAVLVGSRGDAVRVRVWTISRGDKANAWNEYVHRIWPGADTTFFVDGYVQVNPDALALLDAGLGANPECLAASGVPTQGRTATAHRNSMISGGGLHGNMHAIRQSAMEQIRTLNFRLPVGLYRTDSLIGGAMAFRFAPAKFPWNVGLCHVAPTASWRLINMPKGPYAILSTYFKRRLRQAQGQLENLAVKEHMAIKLRPPQELPACSKQMVMEWVRNNPGQVSKLVKGSPLIGYALRKLQRSVPVSAIPSVTREVAPSTGVSA